MSYSVKGTGKRRGGEGRGWEGKGCVMHVGGWTPLPWNPLGDFRLPDHPSYNPQMKISGAITVQILCQLCSHITYHVNLISECWTVLDCGRIYSVADTPTFLKNARTLSDRQSHLSVCVWPVGWWKEQETLVRLQGEAKQDDRRISGGPKFTLGALRPHMPLGETFYSRQVSK